MKITNDLLEGRIYWARVVSGKKEELFTANTKHTFYEIEYALQGPIGMLLENGQTLKMDESDFLIIPPDTYHQVVDSNSHGSRFIMAFSVKFKEKGMQHLTARLGDLHPHRETPHLRPLLEVLQQKEADSPVIAPLLEALLTEILEAVCPVGPVSGGGECCRRVEEMQALIRAHSGIGLQVRDLAQKFNMSERHLHRLFTETAGISPKEAINHEKLKRIEEYAASTSLTLGEIAALCGFCDEYAMNKFFRRYNLTNLSEFRKLSKNK